MNKNISGSVGQLNGEGAAWTRAHDSALREHLPRPGARWKWGETELSHSHLMRLKASNGCPDIVRDGDFWRTPESAVSHVADYGRVSEDDVGKEVLEMMDVEPIRVMIHVPRPGGKWKRSDCRLDDEEVELLVERGLLDELGGGELRTPEKLEEMTARCVKNDSRQLTLEQL